VYPCQSLVTTSLNVLEISEDSKGNEDGMNTVRNNNGGFTRISHTSAVIIWPYTLSYSPTVPYMFFFDPEALKRL
jgi:hypothetical protein